MSTSYDNMDLVYESDDNFRSIDYGSEPEQYESTSLTFIFLLINTQIF